MEKIVVYCEAVYIKQTREGTSYGNDMYYHAAGGKGQTLADT